MLKEVTAGLLAFTVFDAVLIVEIIGSAAAALTAPTVPIGRP